mmetsp:Transcript_44106/g.110472  ORF Transcript_44106/g.110472 Transcript_44106/m.110472 type:complete len:135 (+) Transcript_44106:223-627(+)
MRRAFISRFRRSKPDKEEAPRLDPRAGRQAGLGGMPGIGIVNYSKTEVIPSRPAAATAKGTVEKRGGARSAWDEQKDEVTVTELRLSRHKPPVAIIMQEEVDEETQLLRKSRSLRSSRGAPRAQGGDGGLTTPR